MIEDNQANIELIDYLLTAHGYVTLLATQRRRWVAARRTTAAGPRSAGSQDARDRRLRSSGGDAQAARARHTRIVAVTASAMVGDRERIAAAGFDGYLQKPLDPETFISQIERFLPRAARRA